MIEERMKELGYPVPEASNPLYEYVPVVVHHDLAFISGQLPRVNGELIHTGKVGDQVSVEEAQEAARVCIVNAMAVLKKEIGSLEKVKRIVKITGFVNSAPGFSAQPTVINGASKLLVDIFGDKGRHSRSAVGVFELPSNTPVEIELIVAIEMD